jgi:glycosyltransferase involved in cell wall biosynthesis
VSAKRKIIVSVTNDIFTDQRVRRICEFLHEHNYEIILVGRKHRDSKEVTDRPYKIRRFRLWFNKGALFYANYNLRLFFFLLFKKSDALLANDLDTLYANYWARKFKSNCRLIYDSHEYFCGVPELVERPRIQKFWRRIEKRCVPKVDAAYTVNDSIAELYRQEYNIEMSVVRNITDPRHVQMTMSKDELGLPEDKKIVIMQGAGINVERGAEEAIEAIQSVENAVLIFVGGGDVIPTLMHTVKVKNWEEKVLFFGKRSYEELMNFTHLSDLGLSLDKDTNINYRYSLPNKIFDFIHAGIAVLVSNLPEIKKIVEEYEVGAISESHEPSVLAREISDLLNDPERLDRYKENTKKAAAELSWENECKVLETIYFE